jgi:hypothetical protein
MRWIGVPSGLCPTTTRTLYRTSPLLVVTFVIVATVLPFLQSSEPWHTPGLAQFLYSY